MARSGTGGDQRDPTDDAQQADSPGVSGAVLGGSRCASHEVSQMTGPVARRQANRTPAVADSAPSAAGKRLTTDVRRNTDRRPHTMGSSDTRLRSAVATKAICWATARSLNGRPLEDTVAG